MQQLSKGLLGNLKICCLYKQALSDKEYNQKPADKLNRIKS